MKTGLLTASASRQAGGLFWAVKSLSMGLREVGCDLRVFAGKDASTEQDADKWGDTPLSLFKVAGPAAFGYQVGLARSLNAADLDLVHAHGLWMYPSAAARSWGRQDKPVLISPHGMLDPWALNNSAWKKRVAGFLYENSNLKSARCIHALNDSEFDSIRSYGLNNPVAVLPNGVDLPGLGEESSAPEWTTTLPPGSRVLLFLGRIHPKKGLVNLLNAWAKARDNGSTEALPWQLVIAGWQQGGHQDELAGLSLDLGIEGSVHFAGPQFEAAKDASFRHADAFILPSFSEGLPVAVLEAWSHRLPVFMTPQCNIPEGFSAGAAIRIEPEAQSIEEGLSKLFSMTKEEKFEVGQQGKKLVEGKFTWKKIAVDMLAVYEWMLGGGMVPDCVRFD